MASQEVSHWEPVWAAGSTGANGTQPPPSSPRHTVNMSCDIAEPIPSCFPTHPPCCKCPPCPSRPLIPIPLGYSGPTKLPPFHCLRADPHCGIKGSAPQPQDPAPTRDQRQAELGAGRRETSPAAVRSSGIHGSALGGSKEGASEPEPCPGSVLVSCLWPHGQAPVCRGVSAAAPRAGQDPGCGGTWGQERPRLLQPLTGRALAQWVSADAAGRRGKAQTWLRWTCRPERGFPRCREQRAGAGQWLSPPV